MCFEDVCVRLAANMHLEQLAILLTLLLLLLLLLLFVNAVNGNAFLAADNYGCHVMTALIFQ
jgi:hypothetical protein